jgi:hypothetical protein
MLIATLISTRFLTTIGHFVALMLLFSTIGNNIEVTQQREGGNAYKGWQETTSALIIGVFCFCWDLSGFIMGTSLFNPMVGVVWWASPSLAFWWA